VLLSGRCEVCEEDWAADPESNCACTRPRPGDSAEMARAYLSAARHREAVLAGQELQRAADLERREALARRSDGLPATGGRGLPARPPLQLIRAPP
jgi:hypothetical protein